MRVRLEQRQSVMEFTGSSINAQTCFAQSSISLPFHFICVSLGLSGLGNVAHFPTVGNWEGENGCNSSDQIQRSSSQRLLYVPAPTPQTYPEGGSPTEDYYAFTWGDALFVVLNVMTFAGHSAYDIRRGFCPRADNKEHCEPIP